MIQLPGRAWSWHCASLGYEVRLAETGEAALDGTGGATADVVVLDVMLPGVDGFEVCRWLRRDSDVPVIMLTARGDDFDIVGGLEAGADDYVVKPVEPRVLDARIRAVLRDIDSSILIGAAAGLLPALRAARLSPTQALWSL
jgi:DNA-binding response OmpR family regulator